MKLKETLINSKNRLTFDSFTLVTDTVILPNDKNKDRTYLKHPGGVAILAQNDKDEFLIVNQYRHAIKMITKEIPAGKMDKDPSETILDAAHRELREETGFTASSIVYLGHTYPSAGILDEKLELFFATDLTKAEIDLDDDEFINLEFISKKTFEEMIKTNEIDDSKTVASYFLAKLKDLI
jgi:ADP-ribose pyrophosphatase